MESDMGAKYSKRSVNSSHKTLSSGVQFNVEKVSELGALMDSIDLAKQLTKRTGSFEQSFVNNAYPEEKFLTLQIEVTSLGSLKNVVSTGGFFQAAYQAFARHYPLTIRPGTVRCLFFSLLSRRRYLDPDCVSLCKARRSQRGDLPIQVCKTRRSVVFILFC
jgi:hypothetical protein